MEKMTKRINGGFVLGLIISSLLMSTALIKNSKKTANVLFKFKGKLKIFRKKKKS